MSTDPSGRPTRRRLWRPLLYLASGAFVTIGVAWTCTATTTLRAMFGRQFLSADQPLRVPPAPRWPTGVPGDWRPPLIEQYSDATGVHWHAAATGWEDPHQAVEVYRAGWPMTALRWTQWHTTDSNGNALIRATGAGPLLRWQGSGGPGTTSNWGWVGGWVPRQLPLIPEWPGFAVNSIAFGGAIWAVAWAAGAASRNTVRARRTRRGQCAGCGYSRQGLAAAVPCPECGTPAQATAEETLR